MHSQAETQQKKEKIVEKAAEDKKQKADKDDKAAEKTWICNIDPIPEWLKLDCLSKGYVAVVDPKLAEKKLKQAKKKAVESTPVHQNLIRLTSPAAIRYLSWNVTEKEPQMWDGRTNEMTAITPEEYNTPVLQGVERICVSTIFGDENGHQFLKVGKDGGTTSFRELLDAMKHYYHECFLSPDDIEKWRGRFYNPERDFDGKYTRDSRVSMAEARGDHRFLEGTFYNVDYNAWFFGWGS